MIQKMNRFAPETYTNLTEALRNEKLQENFRQKIFFSNDRPAEVPARCNSVSGDKIYIQLEKELVRFVGMSPAINII